MTFQPLAVPQTAVAPPSDPLQLIDQPRLLERLCVSRTTVWRMIREHGFPRPIHLAGRRVAWRRIDVEKWLDARAAAGSRT
jgi:predicted DNA-binding transcriptional regulator AlpA